MSQSGIKKLLKTIETEEGIRIKEYKSVVRLDTEYAELNLLGSNRNVSNESAYLAGLIDDRHVRSVRGLREKVEGRETLQEKGIVNNDKELAVELTEQEEKAILAASRAYIPEVRQRLLENWNLYQEDSKNQEHNKLEIELGEEVSEYLQDTDKGYISSKEISRNTSVTSSQAGALMRTWMDKYDLDEDKFAAFYTSGTQWNRNYLEKEGVLQEFCD